MINSIQNGDQPLPVIAQVSLARTAQNAPLTLKDLNNETSKDLWDALKRQMRGSEYGELIIYIGGFDLLSLDIAILSGADNRPPMLEKDMYESWKSRMELYMLNRQHGRIILESVEQGPLLWPFMEMEGVTRLKKYFELSIAEAIQADCDVKATNIILQGLPPEVYALVSTHKVAKELWERIQMLMQGTSLTKQERRMEKSSRKCKRRLKEIQN
nr:hypothetical protein [Tanacetum cinerariifolium]